MPPDQDIRWLTQAETGSDKHLLAPLCPSNCPSRPSPDRSRNCSNVTIFDPTFEGRAARRPRLGSLAPQSTHRGAVTSLRCPPPPLEPLPHCSRPRRRGVATQGESPCDR